MIIGSDFGSEIFDTAETISWQSPDVDVDLSGLQGQNFITAAGTFKQVTDLLRYCHVAHVEVHSSVNREQLEVLESLKHPKLSIISIAECPNRRLNYVSGIILLEQECEKLLLSCNKITVRSQSMWKKIMEYEIGRAHV